MKNPAIVIPAFRRAHSLRRLLLSIKDAVLTDTPKIVISLEGEATAEVVKEAESFKTIYPNTEIIRRPFRLGLRAHILACGDLSYEYGSVIVLEDDLMVDPFFYSYTQQALTFYAEDESVAGIALYAPEYNEFAGLPFSAMYNGFDTYFMRTPCSWGQAWTVGQWDKFRKWYAFADNNTVQETIQLSGSVKSWPETSWKKYFAAYMSAHKTDFVYPYYSLTTNCADSGGMHVENGSDLFQVKLSAPSRPLRTYQFAPSGLVSGVCYDEHMEASGRFIYDWLGLSSNEVAIDLYGTKSRSCLIGHKYVVTSQNVTSFEYSIALKFRPVEQNLRLLVGSKSFQAGYTAKLTLSSNIISEKFSNSSNKLVFFSGFNLASTSNSIALVRKLPSQIFESISNRISRSYRSLFK